MMWQDSISKEWCVISYPGESEHLDWKERLFKLPIVIKLATIIHDNDLDNQRNIKKLHRHSILCFPKPIDYLTAKLIIKQIFNIELIQPVYSIVKYYQYFTHSNQPDKFQYDSSKIEHLNGFNILDYQ
ncbi:Rep family protein [Mycoplasma capricolum subsp. capricolum]|uniref:Rep family protein n=1 Tax=Mycoplasma capricolum TaxID=2095 RepID=UPI003DA34B3F